MIGIVQCQGKDETGSGHTVHGSCRRKLSGRARWRHLVTLGVVIAGAAVILLMFGACDSVTATADSGDSIYSQDGGTITETGVSYSAFSTDVNVIKVYGGGNYALAGTADADATLTKTGDTASEDSSNFYGVNSVALAKSGSSISLDHVSLVSQAEGANGAFAYGEGAQVSLSDCTISTSGNSSRGVDATYGGSISISDSSISTRGAHCAALASDRYENNSPPTIIADHVTGSTSGEGSPGIYCTGTFTVSNCVLNATGSEAAAIEGFNSITLTDSDISGSMKWGVFIYQSMSGDSSSGTGTFCMMGGSLTNNSTGPDFMVCNTQAVIELSGVKINGGSAGVLLRACDSSSGDANINSAWGSAGGEVTLSASGQDLSGTVSCNDLSSIVINLSGGSAWTGSALTESGGSISLVLDGDSTWTATGDSVLASLDVQALSAIDAHAGTTITCSAVHVGTASLPSGTTTLASGGSLVVP